MDEYEGEQKKLDCSNNFKKFIILIFAKFLFTIYRKEIDLKHK